MVIGAVLVVALIAADSQGAGPLRNRELPRWIRRGG